MKVFLACLLGAAAVGALWHALLETMLTTRLTFGSPNTQAVVRAISLAFLGTLWGWFAREVFAKKVTK